MKRVLLLVILLAFTIGATSAQPISELYEKAEYKISMRDGVKLHTSVYKPKNATASPILIQRTSYSCAPYGADKFPGGLEKGILRRYVDAGYILVFQDVRGRYMSEGQYENIRPLGGTTDEATDSYDTVDWLVRNVKGNNGKVGFYGNSYNGFYAMLGGLSGHPAVAAVAPQAPVVSWFMGDDAHHNGVLMLTDSFGFLPGMSHLNHVPTEKMPSRKHYDRTPDEYSFFLNAGTLANIHSMVSPASFWDDMSQHPDYDQWWKDRDLRKCCYNVKPAVLVVGGTFDAEDCYGTWNLYKAIRKQSPSTDCRLVIGPWAHGAWRNSGQKLGDFDFGESASWEYYVDSFEFPFFERHLNGADTRSIPPVSIFLSGSNRWREFDKWSPREAKAITYYFAPNGKLSEKRPNSAGGYSEYTSDPANPVPYNYPLTTKRAKEYMLSDQSFLTERDDVLSFTTEPLNKDITLIGEVTASLLASISTTDADFVVKLIDVYPDSDPKHGGYQMLVRGDVMRGRYRNSFSVPEPFVPEAITEVTFQMPDIAHTFKAGHRIMIQVQSSWFPLAERSPQQFVDLWKCSAADYVPCHVKIYHNKSAASAVKVATIK